MAVLSRALFYAGVDGPLADDDPSLPLLVRQMLRQSGSDMERDRLQRWALNHLYYSNEAYSAAVLKSNSELLGSELQRMKNLWSGVKPLFNVLTEAVDVDRDLCFKNARPLPRRRNDALEQRLTEKWDYSDWGLEMDMSPFYGACGGASYLRIIPGVLDGDGDGPARPSRLETHSPETTTVLRSPHNKHRLLAAKIEYQYEEYEDNYGRPNSSMYYGSNRNSAPFGGMWGMAYDYRPTVSLATGIPTSGSLHVRTLIITEEEYFIFRDHRLIEHIDNTLGVVPVIEVPFKDIGLDMGLPTFHSIIDTVDAVNELASMFGKMIKMNADPVLIAYGVDLDGFEKKLDEDGTTTLSIPIPPPTGFAQAGQQPKEVKYLEWSASSGGVLLDFLRMVKEDAAKAMPESLYNQSRSGGNGGGGAGAQVSGFGEIMGLQPLVNKMERIREVQFHAAKRALQTALIADDAGDDALDPEEFQARFEEAKRTYDIWIQADPILPRDRASESQIRSVDLADGVIDLHTARLERGMSHREASEAAERLRKDREEEVAHEKALAIARAAGKPLIGGEGGGSAVTTGRGTQETRKIIERNNRRGGGAAQQRQASQPGRRANNTN